MAIHTVPWTLQSASHGAELFRQTTQSLLAGTGVVGASDLQVTQNGTPNMSVNVGVGQVWIPGTLGGTSAIGLTNQGNQSTYGLPTGLTTQGAYYSINDATVNLAISASNPTNPRIDLVCASVQDAFYSGSTNTVVLQVITGTPAPSPVAPAPPANSVVLAQIAVAANATSILTANITDVRPLVTLAANPTTAAKTWGAAVGLNSLLAYMYARTLSQASSTSNSGGATNGATDWYSAPAFTADGVERVRVTFFGWMTSNTANTTAALRLMEGATVLQTLQIVIAQTGGPGQTSLCGFWEGVPSAGSHTYKLNVASNSTQTVSGLAGATNPSFLLVEHIGT